MSRHVPLIRPDLPAFDEVAEQFQEILENGRITNFGKYVTEFEHAVSRYVGARTRSAHRRERWAPLHLQALGLSAGAKVIVPSFTFMATAQAIVRGRPACLC
jgi:dTDP-4-amino-4,6-dideoxygalactose transaminase